MTREEALAQSPRIAIDTPSVKGSIALKGGRIDDLTLKDYRETVEPDEPNVVLLSPAGRAQRLLRRARLRRRRRRSPRPPHSRHGMDGRDARIAHARLAGDAHLRQRQGSEIHAHHLGRRPIHVHGRRQGDQYRLGAGHASSLWLVCATRRRRSRASIILHEGLIGVVDETASRRSTYHERARRTRRRQVSRASAAGSASPTNIGWRPSSPSSRQAVRRAHFKALDVNGTERLQTDYLMDADDGRAERHGRGRPTTSSPAPRRWTSSTAMPRTLRHQPNSTWLIDWGWFYS